MQYMPPVCSEKHQKKQKPKPLHVAFADPDKTFDHVSHNVNWFGCVDEEY